MSTQFQMEDTYPEAHPDFVGLKFIKLAEASWKNKNCQSKIRYWILEGRDPCKGEALKLSLHQLYGQSTSEGVPSSSLGCRVTDHRKRAVRSEWWWWRGRGVLFNSYCEFHLANWKLMLHLMKIISVSYFTSWHFTFGELLVTFLLSI